MPGFISFLFSFWAILPWVAIALMAFFAYRRNPHSRMLLCQAAGSGAMFLLGILQWVVLWILDLIAASEAIKSPIRYVFGFLLFVALAIFAAGYCLERFRRRGPETVQVSARPID